MGKQEKPKFDPNKDYSPVEEPVAEKDTAEKEKPKFDESKPYEPVKKKDQPEQNQETSSSDSQELGTPSGKNTTSIQLSEEQKRLIAQKPKDQQQLQQEKNSKDFQDTRIKDSFGIAENKSKDPITAFTQTVTSGLSDQLPKEYYTQRLRMSKGSFGDLYDSRSDLNAFGGDKFSENLPKGTSIDAFKEWNNKQSFKVKQQSYDERAKLFLTEKLGSKGFEDLKSKFKVANVEQRIGFEKHIQEQNVEAGQRLGGVVQDLRDVHGANDFLSFAGNMIGQALYRAPTSLAAGPVGSIVSESAAVYDRQLDLIAEKEGISREEVIKKDLDKPAEGQALAVLAGTLDSASEFNIVGMFKKAAGKQLTENVVKQFAKGFVRGAAPEVATEVAQGELEEIAASKGAGVEYHPDGWRMATSAVGALIGGGILGGGANIHLSPELKAMSTEDVVKNTTTNQSSDNIPSIEQAADIIDAKVQGTSEATVAQEKLNPPKEEIPASPITMTDQLPTTSNAIQTKDLTNIQQNDIFVNEKKEPNLLPKGQQEESGVNRKTETDINSEVQNRPIEAAYAWLQAFAGNNSEKIKNIEASMSGQSKNSSEQQASEILGGLNDARSEIRAQIDNGGKNRKTSTEIGARSSQRQEQSEQRSGQSDASKSSGTHDISQGEQGSHGNDDSIDKDSIRKMVSSLFQLREVPKNNESVRIARDLQKMLSTGTQEQKEFIVSLIKENIYAISKSSSAKILSSEPEGTGSQGSERGGVEPSQQGESPTGEVTSQEETVPQDQEKIQGDNSQEQQSEVGNQPESANPDSSAATTDIPENKVDNEPAARKKSILNRAYEGVTDEQVKSSIEKHGLTYEVESHVAAKKSSEEFINEVGIEKATDAVRKNEVEGGQAAFIWATAIDEVGKRIKQAKNKDEIKDLTDQQTKLINEFDKKERLGGQFISALNEVYKSSDFPYNAEYAINKYKEVNHGKISSEQEKIFKDLEAKYEEVVKKLEEVENAKTIESSKKSVKDIHQDFQVQKERRVKIAKARKEKIDSFFDSLKVKNDPNKLNSITQVIGEVVWNGSVEVMRKAVMAGNDVATVIQAGVDYINEHYRGNDFNEDDFRKTVQPGIEKAIANEEADIRRPEMKNGKLSIPKSLIRDLIESGASTIEELTDQVHALIKNDLPDISIREVRDAITKYGETRTLSKEGLDVKVRELKRVGILISQLEDVQNKLRPLRSGVQRDKLTDQERRMQREIKEAMKDLPVDETAADQEWRNALDSVKSRLKNQITDLEDQIKTGEKTPKKTGIKYDQEANDLKEQRDKLKEIIDKLNGKSGYSDEQKVRSAINSVEKTIAEYERRVKEKDFEQKPQSIAQETPELRDLRKKRDDVKALYKKLEQDLGVADKKKLEVVKKNLKKGIERYETRIKNKDFVSVKKKPVALDEEGIKLKIQKSQIKEEFELEQEKNRRANRPMGEKIWDHFVDISTGVQKAFLSTADFSAVLRQGIHYTIRNLLTNPRILIKDFVAMAKMAKSEKFYNEWVYRLKLSPEYDKMKSAGLYISLPTAELTAKEDSFSSNIASRVPILGKSLKIGNVTIPGLDIVNRSERAYAGYLNLIRVGAFTSGYDRITDTGLNPIDNPEAYKQLAKLINNSTGRGNLGALEGAANYLAPIMFSARFTAARFNNLAMWLDPRTYYKTNPTVRKIALENMLMFIGFNLMIMAIYKAGGGDVEDDPRSAEFGKMKQGNNHIDIWSGYQQYVVLMSRLLTGEVKSGHTIKKQNQLKTIGQFARGKASPLVGTIVDFALHEDMEHNNVDINDPETWKREAYKSFVPLIAQDIWDLSEGDPSGLYWIIYSFFGGTVRNYSKSKKPKPASPYF